MSGDYMAERAAKETKPPTGRVHLHLFVARRGLHRVEVSEDRPDAVYVPGSGRSWNPAAKTVLAIDVEWRVSTRASSVCKVPGRCILADIIENRPACDHVGLLRDDCDLCYGRGKA